MKCLDQYHELPIVSHMCILLKMENYNTSCAFGACYILPTPVEKYCHTQ